MRILVDSDVEEFLKECAEENDMSPTAVGNTILRDVSKIVHGESDEENDSEPEVKVVEYEPEESEGRDGSEGFEEE
ncbi:MAG: hypothetical protein PHH85_13060 [Candidatus Methanoperedens sp.]|nr:hypothetical protein [Candidatus Methanoperedens sp.]